MATMKELLVNSSVADKKFLSVIYVALIQIIFAAFHLDVVHWWADAVYFC